MKQFFLIIAIFLFLSLNFSSFSQQSFTITTYYPSPVGIYKELRTKRMAIGDNYYDSSSYRWGIEIDSNADLVVEGNVGIGTIAPVQKLDVRGNAYISGKVGIGTMNPGIYKLYVNGTAYSTGGWVSSDGRLKRIISGIDNPIEKLAKLNGVKFKWKREEYFEKGLPEGIHYGLIAQEVEKVFPEMVSEDNEGYKTLAYTELIPVLIEAVKEQQRMIEKQQRTITILKQEVKELKIILRGR